MTTNEEHNEIVNRLNREAHLLPMKTIPFSIWKGNICDECMIDDNAIHHKHEAKDKERVWSMMFYTSDDQSCAVVGTDDEIAILLTDDTISNTFVMIGESASQWEDDKQRSELIDNALARIKERDSNE